MGGVARAKLAAAVSEAGGLGVIGATGMRPERLREEIRKVRDLTDRPFGVDILLPAEVAASLDPELKRRILEASEEDTRVTRIFTGKTVRVLDNPLIGE
jgi:NAD(P)H-dependent flavin oxidoreductase YrpB (nitropropane dioxygenase family)